jgi:hypothetical protein
MDRHVQLASCHKLLDEVVGDRLTGLVMTCKAAQHVSPPYPMLHDLARGLDKVLLHVGAGESGQLGPSQVLMQHVAEFVKECLDFPVL